MHCRNCGWNNENCATHCVKCGMELHKPEVEEEPITKTIKEICPECGLHIAEGTYVCKNCGTHIIKDGDEKSNKDKEKEKEKKKEKEKEKKASDHIAQCSLRPISMNENSEREKYFGDYVILNRANTDKTNPTITSKIHAIITHENGEWYIENKSTFKTTLLLIKEHTQIKDGNVIVLGDRMFEFKEGKQ